MPKLKINPVKPSMRPDFIAFWEFWQTLPPAKPWEEQVKYVEIMFSPTASEAARQSARQWLIAYNQRLVARLVWQKQAKIACAAHDMRDVFTEGVLGLITAVDKFDPTRGTRLSTHATWWVVQAINRFLQSNRLVHLPCHLGELRSAIFTAANRLQSQGKEAHPDAVYAELISKAKRNVSRAQFDNALNIVINPISLSRHVPGFSGDDDMGELAVMLYRSERSDDCAAVLADYLQCLSELECRVLSKRFGLTPYEPMPIYKIAESEGFAPAWTSKIANRGLRKLYKLMQADGYEFSDFNLESPTVSLYNAARQCS